MLPQWLTPYIEKGMTIGDNFTIHADPFIDKSACDLITIGSNVVMSSRVSLVAHNASTYPPLKVTEVGPIKVGDNCFIGFGATLLYGTQLGDGCIVGAGALVRGTFPPNSVIAGNPAKTITDRTSYIAKKRLEAAKHPERFRGPGLRDLLHDHHLKEAT